MALFARNSMSRGRLDRLARGAALLANLRSMWEPGYRESVIAPTRTGANKRRSTTTTLARTQTVDADEVHDELGGRVM